MAAEAKGKIQDKEMLMFTQQCSKKSANRWGRVKEVKSALGHVHQGNQGLQLEESPRRLVFKFICCYDLTDTNVHPPDRMFSYKPLKSNYKLCVDCGASLYRFIAARWVIIALRHPGDFMWVLLTCSKMLSRQQKWTYNTDSV